ncbi:uncharacterized protein PHACADRAFT_214984 [Phanerochaete carnosa HHB-10118-sp]|uniref:Uncharacterized protein n=1 Tax=Phanerochaete carnosa (strain HHB-10118-sp) TaxID=650164 RepID=K5VN55_PHACS|nr:uncharacterized protein PHACADRAFT_214984 [Phanerochaete carnosa HHB-10118-sp]EKM48029.1 hypothetical protein PHACADRAFT_214984 [Phanerochaete carnosa HHB-10118-sp]
MEKVVNTVCSALGVDVNVSKPRCELYKLLLYETGSHFLSHVGIEKVNGMFATIVVVLPSPFTGGAAHLSHGGMSTYTDVTHEIKPITSGFRLALSYNPVHMTQALRPALSTNAWIVDELRRLCRLRNADEGTYAPEKLVYLLDHKYSRANLNAGALKGADAHRVALLADLAREYGIGLGLAHAVCHLVGSIESGDLGYDFPPSDGYYQPWRYADRSRGRRRAVCYEFEEIEGREMTIEHFVDLDGMLVAKELEYDDNETLPEDLTEDVERLQNCDREKYQGYQGNYVSSLERWYHRSVLMIYPGWSTFSLLYSGEGGLLRACTKLESTRTSPPTKFDHSFAEEVLLSSELPRHASRVASAVCHAGLSWNDAALRTLAIKRCCPYAGLATLPDDGMLAGLMRVGWPAVCPSSETMLYHEKRHASRLGLLARFTLWAETQPLEMTQAMRSWAQSRIQPSGSSVDSEAGHGLTGPPAKRRKTTV